LRAGRAPAAAGARRLALAAALLVLGGCAAPARVTGPDPQPIAAAHVLVTRPFRANAEPDRFIQAAVSSITEELIRAGYDWMGSAEAEPQVAEPQVAQDVAARLADLNARRPGTAIVHLQFVEAPTLVGFGTAYTEISCTVY